MKVITRQYLAEMISSKLGFSVTESVEIVDEFFQSMVDSICKSETIKITKFGNFEVRRKKERLGRNPRTKEKAVISARKVISFYQSNYLKSKLRPNNE